MTGTPPPLRVAIYDLDRTVVRTPTFTLFLLWAAWREAPWRLLLLPALAALAAFALPTFQRSVSALIDWFTLLFFSFCAIVIWVIWLSLQTGVPAKPASNVARLAPGFEPSFGWLPFVAVPITAAWNAYVCRLIMREARIRAMGPSDASEPAL